MPRWFSDEQRTQRRIQLFFLGALFRKNGDLVLRGGTALDLFYESGRFSEDLDFDCRDLGALTEINRVIGSLGAGKEYAVFNDWKADRELRKNFTRYLLRVSSVRLSNLVNFVIDCTIDAPKYPPDTFVFNYNDSLINIRVMKAQEILAEKVSAVINREKARDLYDLYHLAVVKHVTINIKDVHEKCAKRFSSAAPRTYSFGVFEASVRHLARRWEDMNVLLQHPGDYPFEEVSGRVLELFRNL